jgi:hypothetical protein
VAIRASEVHAVFHLSIKTLSHLDEIRAVQRKR